MAAVASRDRKRYLTLILISTFLFGSSFPATKAVLTEVSPLWAVCLRFLAAALSITPLLIWRGDFGGRLKLKPVVWGQVIVIGLLQTTGSMAFLNLGLQSIAPPKAAILMACAPLIVAVMARLILRETVFALAYAGMGVALFGVALCLGLDSIGSSALGVGELLVICGAFCWAAATVAIKKFAPELDVWALSFWQMLIGAIALALIALLNGEPFGAPVSLSVWGAFAWLAIPATTGAMGLWFQVLRLGSAVHASGFLFLSPLFATLITFALTGNLLTMREIAGGVLIGAGIYLASLPQRGEASASCT
ncbi:DMT family transporter [Hahella sp. KA22]|uniref:DMT family transporter n=1 Tax=unclassified Hahella TaxID=2624107 RepID=UPI000FDD97A6|nr:MULTISPECIES: DMT family transporter [unclassified Hahella]AZZ90130.1 DMT family transporter [Hahella sp. KA22]MBU6954100.1 DMT family transporter [Hahella sp. HN01]QAY53500.1 DMT family transporter [Hahella sp. KA22]